MRRRRLQIAPASLAFWPLLAKLALKEHPVRQLWLLPISSTMGRPAKTLLERVLAGSFRADRYGSLLAGKLLPKTSPFSDPFRRRIWEELREAQQEYQEAVASKVFSADWHRAVCARGFSKSVRALHGGRPPSWTREKPMNPRLYRRRLERILAELPPR